MRGKVAEIYGGDFILVDASGRTLVRGGADGLVAGGDTVTVQGAVRDGTLRPMFLVGADGGVTALRGHRGGPHEHGRRPGGEGPAPAPASASESAPVPAEAPPRTAAD